MSQNRNVVAEYEDRYGDQRTIHRTRKGLQVARQRSTAATAMSVAAGQLIGARIREARLAAGMTLEELAVRAGLATATPKNRMWEIETASRVSARATQRGGLSFGTVYAIAYALGLPIVHLIPSAEEIMAHAGIQEVALPPTLMPVAGLATGFRVAAE